MLSLGFLSLALLAASRGFGPPIVAAALLLGVFAGIDLPDVDQLEPVLAHRSALTHSLLPAAIPLGWRRLWPVAAGLACGLALHLAADTFPRGMTGYATVKLPGVGSLAGWSYLWLAGNAAAAVALFAALLPRCLPVGGWTLASLGVIGLTGLAYLLRVPGGWSVLALVGAGCWATTQARRRGLGA